MIVTAGDNDKDYNYESPPTTHRMMMTISDVKDSNDLDHKVFYLNECQTEMFHINLCGCGCNSSE